MTLEKGIALNHDMSGVYSLFPNYNGYMIFIHVCCHDGDGLEGGSVGGTPHSGTPGGRWIRLGSHSSSAVALSFCNSCIRNMKRRVSQERCCC
jgi:hypothetical protein